MFEILARYYGIILYAPEIFSEQHVVRNYLRKVKCSKILHL